MSIALKERWGGVVAWWRALWTLHGRHVVSEQTFSTHAQSITELFYLARQLGEGGQDLTELIFRIWSNAQSFAQSEDAKLKKDIEELKERLRWYEQKCEPIRYQRERLDQHRAKLAELAKAIQPEVNDGSTAATAAAEQPAQPDGSGSAPESPVPQSEGSDADGQAGSPDVGGQPYDGNAGTG